MEENKIKNAIRTMRRALNVKALDEHRAPDDPFVLFEQWMGEALKKEAYEPNAMVLATVSKGGAPRARTVLLKDFDPSGFVFFTNYNSRKGEDLNANPRASLVFYWGKLSRQVQIEGIAQKVERDVSVAYFHSRPRKSQIAAYISPQSQTVQDRRQLERLMNETEDKFKGQEIPCPEFWGGYRLVPQRMEFWQGRPDRLHDRVCYTRNGDRGWRKGRLAP